MATHKLVTLKSYFNLVYESFPADLVQRMMMKVCSFIWVFVLSLFRHLIEHLAGSRKDDDHVENSGSNCSIFDGFEVEEKSEFTFGFQFQMKEEDLIEKAGDVFLDRYQFVSVQDLGGFVAEPESASFTVHELFVEPASVEDDFIVKENGIVDDFMERDESKDEKKQLNENSNLPSVGKVDDFMEMAKSKDEQKEVDENSNLSSNLKVDDFMEKVKSKDDQKELNENSNLSSNGKVDDFMEMAESKDEQKEFNENSNLSSDEEELDDFMESEVSSGEIPQRVDLSAADSIISEEKSKEFVADASSCDEVEDLQEKSELNLGKSEELLKTEQVNWLGDFFMRNDSFCYESEFDSPDHRHHLESDESHDGITSIGPQDVDLVIEQESESVSPTVLEETDDDCIELEPNLEKKHESDSCLENSMESEIKFEEERDIKSWEFDSDEEEDADILLEHQELIGQMKMELKNSRTGGLPTILEEVETPRMKEDYKPLKINEKLEHRDQMAEIQKFYKSYTEKMRKLDVLNYQTLQAINFLRMKHPDQLNTGENTSLSAIKSVVFPSLWPCKLRRIYADPTLKSITELHKDLEIVYVGQACLSWEILHWQYKKAKELQLYDPQGYRSYNQIAIEFQQFHVLLKRFTEDELFQGPRVQNYTKQRCNLRGFLQVPAIKDDNLKEKKSRNKEEGEAVSISTMTKIIKESMTVFWEFLHTDKDTTNLFLTIILQGSKAHLQDPADSELFEQIKTIHQKKQKRLKDMLRTGNCIVKKFQKQQETILDQHMFVSQVELRLISRVLNLPRLTRDQLLWCHSKLNNIIFIDRKIQVEDSLFVIFPC